MAKPGFWSDTFEQLAELGKTTGKQSAKSVAQTFNPVKILEQAAGSTGSPNEGDLKNEFQKKKNHTPMDFDKLQKKYQEKDTQNLATLRNRLFQMVKSGDEKILAEKKQEEEEMKRKIYYDEMEKKRRKQATVQQQSQFAPKGKEKRGLFSPKKKAQAQHAETKPATGKQ
ncbi:MAG: hypothetical protein Q7S61_03105 [bacterium]|nr:hypothetical protein [bacterium]